MYIPDNEDDQLLTGSYYERQPNTVYRFKICLIGDGGVGKTTFLNRVLNGDFISRYCATQSADTKILTLPIGNNSYVKYYVWDTAGQEKNVGLKDGYYINSVAAFFFFAANSRETMVSIPRHMDAFVNACGVEAPKMFILANKIDVTKGVVQFSKHIQICEAKYNTYTLQISARTGYNFELPFLELTRKLLRDDSLVFVPEFDEPVFPSQFTTTQDNQAAQFADFNPEL